MTDVDSKTQLSIRQFMTHVPVPFEDEVTVHPCNLDPTKLNRILTLERVLGGREKQLLALNHSDYCIEYSRCDTEVTLNTKRRFLNHQPNLNEDALTHFVKTQIDYSCKESIKSYLKAKYLKCIPVRNNKSFLVPKSAQCSFIMHGKDTLAKHLLEEISEFAVATNNPKLEIELRKTAYVPRFNYAAVFRHNMTPLVVSETIAPALLVSEGETTIMVSNNDEILGCYKSIDKLAKALKTTSIHCFHTQRPSIRRKLHGQFNVNIKLNKCLPKARLKALKRVLRTTRHKLFYDQKFVQKGGVIHLDRKKLNSLVTKDKTVLVHDFSSFYPSTVVRTSVDDGIKRVFRRLIKHRNNVQKLKLVANTMFGMSKRYYPQLFHRTLNETVYLMYKVYKRNRRNVFAMCKDSFFSVSDQLTLPSCVSGYHLKVDHKMTNFNMTNINTYAGIEERTNCPVLKGLQYAPFDAARKIVLQTFMYLVEHPDADSIDLPQLIKERVSLAKSDFYVNVTKKLKTSDYFYYGVNEVTTFLYTKEIVEKEVYHIQASEPTVSVRPENVCGRMDVRAYVNQVLTSLIRFARTFGYLHIINENVIYETDLFLKQYIQNKIFERVDNSSLPGFTLHECQLLTN